MLFQKVFSYGTKPGRTFKIKLYIIILKQYGLNYSLQFNTENKNLVYFIIKRKILFNFNHFNKFKNHNILLIYYVIIYIYHVIIYI